MSWSNMMAEKLPCGHTNAQHMYAGDLLPEDCEKLVLITDTKTGGKRYGKPRHIPMRGWNDYDIIPELDLPGEV